MKFSRPEVQEADPESQDVFDEDAAKGESGGCWTWPLITAVVVGMIGAVVLIAWGWSWRWAGVSGHQGRAAHHAVEADPPQPRQYMLPGTSADMPRPGDIARWLGNGGPIDRAPQYYFTYGSNMNERRYIDRIPAYAGDRRQRQRLVGLVDNRAITFDKRAQRPLDGGVEHGYTNIVPSAGNHIYGFVYACTEEDLRQMDFHEGLRDRNGNLRADPHYVRGQVAVTLQDGQQVQAVTYIASDRHRQDGLRPSQEYLAHLLAGFEHDQFTGANAGLPAEYLHVLANVVETAD